MNILLTGATGFSGSILLKRLVQKNHIIYIIEGKRKLSKTVLNENIVSLGNINNIDISKIPNFDVLIHCAAQSPQLGIMTFDYIQKNIYFTSRLISLAIKKEIKKVIFFSSLSAFGEIKTNFVSETTPIINPDIYGMSKLICEKLLEDNNFNFNSVSLRLPGILGKNSKRNWLSNIKEKIIKGDDIIIYNPDSYFNNAVWIEDLLDFTENLMKIKFSGFNTFPLAAKSKIKIIDLVKKINFSLGNNSKIIISDKKVNSFQISNDLAEKFGYKPKKIHQIIDLFSKC